MKKEGKKEEREKRKQEGREEEREDERRKRREGGNSFVAVETQNVPPCLLPLCVGA
jgi:hypothetical protein